MSARHQQAHYGFDYRLALYLEDTIRIERRPRTAIYGKLVFALTAALLLMQAPHSPSFAGKIGTQTQVLDAASVNQTPDRFAFAGPQFRLGT